MFYALQIWISDLLFEIYVPLHSFADNVIEQVKGLTSAVYQYFFQQQDRQQDQNDNNEQERDLNNQQERELNNQQRDPEPENWHPPFNQEADHNNGSQELEVEQQNNDEGRQQLIFNADSGVLYSEAINPLVIDEIFRHSMKKTSSTNMPMSYHHNKGSFVPQISIGRFIKGMFALLGLLFVVHALQHNPRQKDNLLKSSAQPASPMIPPELSSLFQKTNNQSKTERCLQQFPFENISTIATICGVSDEVVSTIIREQHNEPACDSLCRTSEATHSCTDNLMKRNPILSFNSASTLCDSSVKSLNAFGPHKKQLKKEAAAACVEENPTTKASQFCHKAAHWAVQATNQLNKGMDQQPQPISRARQFIRSQWNKAQQVVLKR